ncbi:unnamed protein product [Acanthoscelides obtectus]|uniref:Uncharacterized protein n=1 Tax=Acanthoscelides obtectus TaxID=200917 RepID=A0A9P0JYK4_ACAOB|nr:unnamed protein product [Acanthoscelides obtectus]CAK1647977.1 hypothetical protein AOBTE_LOCUS15483 [Acanthoscelides obtectus]
MRSTTRTQLHQATTTGTCTWTSKSSTGNSAAATSNRAGTATANRNVITADSTSDKFSQDFENLQLSVNQLDVTSQKSKAVVSRSASRRPPTRQRSYRSAAGSATTPLDSAQAVAATNLHRVSRLCHQIHATAVKQAFTRSSVTSATHVKPPSDDDANTVEIVELESTSSDNTNAAATAHGNGSTVTHTNLVRTKSSSSEDIHILSEKSNSANKSIEDLDDLEQLQTWRRTSKLRRSLQFPKQNKESSSINSTSKPIDIPKNSVSVKKMKEDLEKGRRLNTVLRNNSVDLEALDQILQSVSGSVISDKNSEDSECEANKKQKRNSFVTVESIQEVKGRLRRTSSHSSDIYKENGKDDDDVADDGIVVEETSTNGTYTPITAETSRVKSYVYGMEAALLTKKPGVGTGSLESRVKLVNGNSSAKNEDWYNRRKSYGFEQVQAHEDSSSCILKSKKLVESSTDSGICRSSEIVSRTNNSLNENQHNLENGQDHKTNGWKEVTTGQVKKLASTYDSSVVGQGASCWPLKHTELKSTTITIPIVKNNNVVDLPWYDDSGGGEIKRHSIAVDESQYVRRVQPINDPKYRRTSLVTNGSNNTADLFEDETNTTAGIRRTKKVEFCRTEVHFAAESGKVNIVATDEKPPPTQNFRRRRRNSGPLPADFGNKNGTMPVLRFGDSSEEQTMFGVAGDGSGIETGAQMSPRLRRSREAKVNQSASEDRKTFGVVTVNAGDVSCQNNMTTPVASERLTAADEDKKDPLSENEIKGILKNKPIKPKPYHLGEAPSPIPIVTYPSSDEETSSKWGVKLRHVEKSSTYNAKSSSRDSPPIWKSTVTVHNFYEKNSQEQVEDGTAVTPEFQKRLRNLRPTRKSECEYASDSDIKRSTLWNQEDSQGMEQKGCYSTKIHFGEGEATVLENDDRLEGNTTWPTLLKNLPNKDSKPLLQKGQVVRIGKEGHPLNHTVRSKIITSGSENSNTTTTKITIDLSPSPLPEHEYLSAHQRSHFKSTSLILNTIKENTTIKEQQQGFLEGAKRIVNGYQNHLRIHSKQSSPVKMLLNTTSTGRARINQRNCAGHSIHEVEEDYLKVPNMDHNPRKIELKKPIKRLSDNYESDESCTQQNLLQHPKPILDHVDANCCSSRSHGISENRNDEGNTKMTKHIQKGDDPSKLPHSVLIKRKSNKYVYRTDSSSNAYSATNSQRRTMPIASNDYEVLRCPRTDTKSTLSSVNDKIAYSRQVVKNVSDNAQQKSEATIKSSRDGFNDNHRLLLNNPSKTGDISTEAISGAVALNNYDLKLKTEQDSRWGEQNSLEVLKRLYEDANSSEDCSDADKEVQQLMTSRTNGGGGWHIENDGSSEVSGSWSKMRAYKIMWGNRNRTNGATFMSSAQIVDNEKDSAPQLTSHTVADNPPKSTVPVKVTHTKDGSSPTREQPSPTRKVQRNSWPAVRPDITLVEKLSSPSLVGKTEKEDVVGSHLNNDALKQSLRRIADNIVIRQPKKSEMTYFGVKVSPGPEKKVSQAVIKKEPKLSQKPGLLHHHKKSPSPTRCKFNKPRQESPEPIYENIHINNKYKGKEFDSSILDELTKAADQILQSVNGYTDEDSQSKQSTDEEKKKLETIDEARSLKPTTYSTEQKIPSNQKYKLRHTSSTSSVESVTKKKEANEKMTTTAERQAALQQQKKKQEKSDSSTSSKAHLKARRLQRASSREALLHSHGSSSEDLPNRIEVAIRKPRLVRKTKSVQLSMTNGLELKKPNTAGDSPAITKLKEDRCINKADERILNSLPEVRHKTAVSTIRSTSEKMSKDKAKYKHEDMKKKTPSKRDTNRGTISATPTMNSTTNSKPTALQSGAAPTSSKSLTPVKVKTVGVTAAKSDRQRYHQSQQQSNSTTATAASAAITQHRISTANIKKCVNGRPTTMVTNLKT